MAELLVEKSGGIVLLTLNRPEKRNALNDALIRSLANALVDAGNDENLRAIMIRGGRQRFLFGGGPFVDAEDRRGVV